MKHPLKSYTTGAYKSCQLQNELHILINIVQNYPMQEGITRMLVLIVPTEKGNLKYAYTQKAIVLTIVVICYSTNKSCQLQ